MAIPQQQSAHSDGGDSYRLVLTIPEGLSTGIFNSWLDDPSLGGAGPSGLPHETMDLSGHYTPWQAATSTAGLLAHQPEGFDFGSTTTPVTDQGYNPSIPTHTPVHRQRWNTVPRVPTSNHPINTLAVSQLFDPMGYTDPSFITDIVQQECERLSSAAGGNQRVVPSFGPEEVGGEDRISVHPSANYGAPATVQSPRQAHRQTEPNVNMHPPGVSFQTGHNQSANDGIGISSMNNQMQISAPGSGPIVDVGLIPPAPAPNGDEVVNPREDNGNFGVPGWVALMKPLPQAEDRVLTLRRETHVTLDLNFEQISAQLSEVCSGIKIPATGSVKDYADTTGKFLLEFRINLYGATTKRRYKNVCANCEKRDGKKKGILSPIDFKTRSDMIVPKDGKIRIDFVFCCYPKDHRLGDGEYLVEVVLSKDADQNHIVARHQLPFSFNVVPKYCQAQSRPPPTAGTKRDRYQIEESEEMSSKLDRRNVRLRSEGPSQGVAGNQRIDDATPAINLRDSLMGGRHRDNSPSSSIPLTPLTQMPPNAGPNSDSLNPPHQEITPPRTDQQPTPTLVDVNPESGSITGGARIWLKGKDFPAAFPLFARFGTAVVPTDFSSSTLLSCHLPPATLPGLVDVTLSKDHQPNAPEYGTSIAKFQYLRDQDQLLPILLRIQGQAYPEFAPVLQALFTALSGSQRNQVLQGRSGVVQLQENPIETGLVHALSCIQARPNFREIVSTTNEYGQSLAHLAILYDYPSLLHHLVDWDIDLAISDVNGLTALHCAYMKGDLHTVRVLRRGDAPEAAKDRLGRIPSDLQPEGFPRGFSTDVEMDPSENDIGEQVALGFSALALHEDDTSEHGQSESEDDAPDAKEPASIAVDSFADGDEGARGSGRYQIAPGFKEPVIERFLPCPPSNISNNNVSRILREAALKPDCDFNGGSGRNTMTISDVEDLRRGIIRTSNNKDNAPYTILLLGETNVGKTSFLTLLANVLHGKDVDHYDFEVPEPTNEQGGNQSRTKSTRIYELKSNNGMVVRVIDTPGFADTRCILQDEPPEETIASQIKKHIDSVTAVLVLANVTAPGVTIGTNSALSALSTIFPQHPTNNVAFVLTNVSSPLDQMFSGITVPDALKDAPQFILNDPVALQKRYLMFKDDPHVKRGSTYRRDGLKADEHDTLEMMVQLFHWLDSLVSCDHHGPFPTLANDINAPFDILGGTTSLLSMFGFGQLGGFGGASGLAVPGAPQIGITVDHKGSPENRIEIDYPLGGGDAIITTTDASLPRPANKQEDLSIGVDGLDSKRSSSIKAGTINELKKLTNTDTSPDLEHHDHDQSGPSGGDDDPASHHVKGDPEQPDKPLNNYFANNFDHSWYFPYHIPSHNWLLTPANARRSKTSNTSSNAFAGYGEEAGLTFDDVHNLLDNSPFTSLPLDSNFFVSCGEASAFKKDEDFFSLDDWLDSPLANLQHFDGPQQIAPVQHLTIDTKELLMASPGPFPPPMPGTTATPIPSQLSLGDSSLLMTPSVMPSSFSCPTFACPPPERASAHSPFGLQGSSQALLGDASSYDWILNQGYPGHSIRASERRDILRRTITNEIAQLPISARDIKKLAEIRRHTDDIPDDDIPSSGKRPASAVLQCAWVGCDHVCNRPDRLKTHVYTHIAFKPFSCDQRCGDPHCTARFHSKGDCTSHQTKHEKKRICENCGEECTGKNWQRHARAGKCKNNARGAPSFLL